MRIVNLLIVVISVLAVYCICAVGLGWFWKIGDFANAEAINAVLLNLSYSYIAGAIFYVFISFLPHLIMAHKLKKPLQAKFNNIRDKFSNSINSVYPIEVWNTRSYDRNDIISRFKRLQSVHTASPMRAIHPGVSVMDHLRAQRDAILKEIRYTLEYKDYLSSEQIIVLEKIRNCAYFPFLNAFGNPALDLPNMRESLAKELCDAYDLSRLLN
ncbi:MAG: hypothetical protein J1F20_02250 [Muribaculaceae bacterium]|nr:hypothetical protein [Muribaculaceae bacterium]